MIKIGDFARLGQVSITALHHYDNLGLLKPALIDKETGYRYYSGDQLSTLNRIITLKDLGFSLEQIEKVLGGLTADQLRGMLMFKQAEVERQVAAEQDRLARDIDPHFAIWPSNHRSLPRNLYQPHCI